MKNYNTEKAVIIRDAKSPCLMVMRDGEVEAMLHIVGNDVWATDFDTFMDAGFAEEHSILPIAVNEGKGRACADAWVVFEGIEEYGEPGNAREAAEWRLMFAALWKYKTGNELRFKEVA